MRCVSLSFFMKENIMFFSPFLLFEICSGNVVSGFSAVSLLNVMPFNIHNNIVIGYIYPSIFLLYISHTILNILRLVKEEFPIFPENFLIHYTAALPRPKRNF